MRIAAPLLLLALLSAAPASASVEDCLASPFSCFVVDFERYPQGTTFIDLEADYGGNTERLLGGTVEIPGVTAPDVFTPRSGENVYLGTAITFNLADPNCCSWGAVGAYVTGEDVVTARAYVFDYQSLTLRLAGTLQTDGRNVAGSDLPPHFNLEFGNWGFGCDDPDGGLDCGAFIVRVEFSSSAPFSIDDFYYGGPAGIPEPATWALFLSGFALVGAATRWRLPA